MTFLQPEDGFDLWDFLGDLAIRAEKGRGLSEYQQRSFSHLLLQYRVVKYKFNQGSRGLVLIFENNRKIQFHSDFLSHVVDLIRDTKEKVGKINLKNLEKLDADLSLISYAV